MPFGVKPFCSTCKSTVSTMWRKDENGTVMCNSCYLNHIAAATSKDETSSVISDSESINSGSVSNGSGLRSAVVVTKRSDATLKESTGPSNNSNVRKSSRIKPANVKTKTKDSKSNPGKGKSRRFIFKKNAPIKSHPSVATIVTRQSLFYQGVYIQVGDIVSLVDHSGEIYYAQLRALLQDQYCEKSGIITWLLPTTATNPEKFDPATYILGPSEEIPRKLEYMEFVCHAPADYYKPKRAVIDSLHSKPPDTGFIWTSIGPQVCKLPTTDEIFGTHSLEDES